METSEQTESVERIEMPRHAAARPVGACPSYLYFLLWSNSNQRAGSEEEEEELGALVDGYVYRLLG